MTLVVGKRKKGHKIARYSCKDQKARREERRKNGGKEGGWREGGWMEGRRERWRKGEKKGGKDGRKKEGVRKEKHEEWETVKVGGLGNMGGRQGEIEGEGKEE